MSDSANSKLELGLERLAKAGTDADLLGLALQSLHGALEDAFRAQLAADTHVPAAQRADITDPKKVQWKDLLDAMVLYRDLGADDRRTIWRVNGLRTRVAHGERSRINRAELESYAALVQRLIGYTPPAGASPAPVPQPAAKPRAKAASSPAAAKPRPSPSAAPDIPRAVRSRPSAPPPRSRMSWMLIAGACALLLVLALAALVRNSAATGSAAPTEQLPTQAEAAAAAEPSPAPAPTARPRNATVRADGGLFLRANHSTAAQILATLPDGARVTIADGPVEAENRSWWQVEDTTGKRGWCAGDFLVFEQP
jgi:hypothetical protein